MTDLAEWLLACIAEDEERARELLAPYAWGYSTFYEASPKELDHIARHDPARVLAECAAKRRIVEEHGTEEACSYHPKTSEYPFGCTTCHRDPECGYVMALGWCQTVRLLALPYAGREGYDERWRPKG